MPHPSHRLVTVILSIGLLILVGSTIADARSAPAQPQVALPTWGTDIQINSVPALPAVGRNIALAGNPRNPQVVIAGYDSVEQNGLRSGYAGSSDAGRTWTAGRFEGPWGTEQFIPLGNTSVAFDAAGIGYYATQAATNTINAYFVLTTTNGSTWSSPIQVASAGSEAYRSQAILVADPRPVVPAASYAGSLYMFWYFTKSTAPYYLGIQMRYSRDGGRTWSADVQVSSPANFAAYNPTATVAADGTIYVAFEEVDNFNINNPPKLYVNHSTDGGVKWGADQLIAGAPIVPIGRPDYKGRELVLLGSADCVLLRAKDLPTIAVAPDNSRSIYALWNDGRWNPSEPLCDVPGRHSDIAFSHSTDSGLTWTAPTRVNDDPPGQGVDHFQPTVQVAADGTIGVTWYDRRYDPAHYLYDLTYSQSSDGGKTWSADQRVSDVSSDANSVSDYKGIDDIGYRKALIYGPDYVLPGWLDARHQFGEGDAYVDHGLLGTPSATATATTTPTVTASPSLPPPSVTGTALPSPTVTVTATTSPCTIVFSDVPPDNVFHGYVQCLACQGVLAGYSDGTFRPTNPVTRGQAISIIAGSAGYSDPIPPDQQTFADVLPGQTFWQAIERAGRRQVIGGYTCGGPNEDCDSRHRPYFRPAAPVTRGQLAKIVAIAAGFTLPFNGRNFADVPPDQPFYPWIEQIAHHGIISGYSCGSAPAGRCLPPDSLPYYLPGNEVTRGQTAKIVAGTFFPTCPTLPAQPRH